MEEDKGSDNRVDALRRHVRNLQGMLSSKKLECQRLYEEAARWKRIAEQKQRDLNTVRMELLTFLDERSGFPMYQKLNEARAERDRVADSRNRYRQLAHRSIEGLKAARQDKRDADEVVTRLGNRVAALTQELEDTAANAQDIIDQRDTTIHQLKNWCEKWIRGDLGSLEVIATIAGLLNGNLVVDPSVLERRKAMLDVQMQARNAELADQLGEIGELLAAEGVFRTGDPVQQVKSFIELMRGVEAVAKEGS